MNVLQWVSETAERYPEVLCILLIGSWANGTAKANSDFDFIVCLHDQTGMQIEKEIALANQHKPIDIFFLRPGGKFARWQKSIAVASPLKDDNYSCYLTGELFGENYGQWEALYLSIINAVCLFERTPGLAKELLSKRLKPARVLLVDWHRFSNWLNILRFRLGWYRTIQIFDAPNFIKATKGREYIFIPPDPEGYKKGKEVGIFQ